MDEKARRPSFYAILTPEIRYAADLTPNEKLLMAEISAMTDTTGYCWASNAYFSKLFGISERTVIRSIHRLEAKGAITTELVLGAKGNIQERRIRLPGAAEKVQGGTDNLSVGGTDKNVRRGTDKNVTTLKDNNINNNNSPHSPPKGAPRLKAHPDFCPERFAQLWAWYPHEKRGNKQRAIRAWDALRPDDALIDTIGHALVRQAKTDDWERGIGIPHLSTYLNGASWEGWDEEEVNARQWTPED